MYGTLLDPTAQFIYRIKNAIVGHIRSIFQWRLAFEKSAFWIFCVKYYKMIIQYYVSTIQIYFNILKINS